MRIKRLGGKSTNDVFESEMLPNIKDLTREICLLKSKSSEVILFHQLGFCGPEEADAWVEQHWPSGRYGLVVDFHIMMEHIFQKIKGIDVLARLEKVHKIQVGSNAMAFLPSLENTRFSKIWNLTSPIYIPLTLG